MSEEETLDAEQIELQRKTEKWEIKDKVFRLYAYMLVALSIFFAVVPLAVDNETAKNFSEFSSIIITILGVFGAVVCAYFGSEAMVKKEQARINK